MPKFIQVGNAWINVESIASIRQDRDGGPYTLFLIDGRIEPVSAIDGRELIELAKSNLAVKWAPVTIDEARKGKPKVEKLEPLRGS